MLCMYMHALVSLHRRMLSEYGIGGGGGAYK